VIDRQFNTTDILIVLPVAAINNRYFARYGAPDAMRASGGLTRGRRPASR
jgi:putative hemolysin